MDKRKKKQKMQEEEEEREFLKARGDLDQDDSSDSDSIMSDMGDEEPEVKVKRDVKAKQDSKENREKWKQNKLKESEEKLTAAGSSLEKKPGESKNLNFTAADSIAELKSNRKKLSKMTLADRLDMEVDTESIKQHTFGSREMNYVIKKAPKFERIKQQQKEHQEERRKIRRSTTKLKGKFNAKEPLL